METRQKSDSQATGTTTMGQIAGMLQRGEIATASFTASEWIALVEKVPRRDWSRIDDRLFAVRQKVGMGRWAKFEWWHHEPDADGCVVSIRHLGWL